jgi:transposase
MPKKTRRQYKVEFKAAAVARLDEPGETLSGVAQAMGVVATQVKTWRLEHQAADPAEAVARRWAEMSELQQLRRDNKRLQEDNEILRKASAFSPDGRRKQESEARLHRRPRLHLFNPPTVHCSGRDAQLVPCLVDRRSDQRVGGAAPK